MSRVCVIGDSHLGALKYGIDTSPAEFDITTFACRNESVSNLVLAGRSLVAGDEELRSQLAQFSGGTASIDIESYDHFVVVGFSFWFVPIGLVYKNYVCDSMMSTSDGRYMLSEDSFTEVCYAELIRSEGARIARAIRTVTDKPITLVAAPNLAEGLEASDMPHWFPPLHEAEVRGDAVHLKKIFLDVCARLSNMHQIAVVPPLAEVAASSSFNRREFSLLADDDTGLSTPEKLGKLLHGNHHYGSILVRHVFDAIRKSH